jgi:Ribbon-helix-helix protein, copG family
MEFLIGTRPTTLGWLNTTSDRSSDESSRTESDPVVVFRKDSPLTATGFGLTVGTVWPYYAGMATQTIKTTYALDVETVRTLERVARRWGVSRSEALRRAIRVAARDAGPASDALVALDALQRSLGLSATAARAWASRVRAERRASARRRQIR